MRIAAHELHPSVFDRLLLAGYKREALTLLFGEHTFRTIDSVLSDNSVGDSARQTVRAALKIFGERLKEARSRIIESLQSRASNYVRWWSTQTIGSYTIAIDRKLAMSTVQGHLRSLPYMEPQLKYRRGDVTIASDQQQKTTDLNAANNKRLREIANERRLETEVSGMIIRLSLQAHGSFGITLHANCKDEATWEVLYDWFVTKVGELEEMSK